MTSKTLEKYRKFTLDKEGRPIAVSLDLQDTLMKKFFSTMMEDFEDTLLALERQDEEVISLEEVIADLNIH